MNKKPKFAVLGAGNGGVATAADLSVRGFSVNLWEHPDFADNLRPIQKLGGIELEVLPSTNLENGFGKLNLATTNIEEALENVDVVMVITPAFAHKSVAEFCAPYFHDNQVVIISPGNFGGALQFYNAHKAKGTAKNVIFAEAECMIYACRKKSPTSIWIRGYKRGLRIAALPSKHNEKVINLIRQAYPACNPASNIIETGISNPNSAQHTPIMVMNAGLIERTKGDFLFYHEGVTPSIVKVMEAIDEERMKIGKVFKTEIRTGYEQDVEWYGYQSEPGNNLYENLTQNGIYKWSKAPDSLNHRYLTEDIPYGLVAVEDLGKKAGIQTPMATAMIDICQTMLEKDLRKEARTLEKMGLGDKSVEEILQFIESGE